MVQRARRLAPLFLAVCLALPALGSAAERDWLPSSKELFRPLEADPKEIGYRLRWTAIRARPAVTEIGLGDYLGIVRAPLGGWDWQASLGGGAIARFDTSRPSRDFEVADFTLALPFDLRKDRHAFRAAIWHVSSHVGDDYVRRRSAPIFKSYTDELVVLYSFSATPFVRLYAGGARAFVIRPTASRKRGMAGFELGSRPFMNGRAQAVLAAHGEWYERRGDNVAVSLRAGLRAVDEQRVGALTAFVGLYEGPLYYQYRYPEREAHLTLGLSIEMGSPIPDAPVP